MYVFDSSILFKEKGGTNIIYFNEDYKRNSKSNVESRKIKLLVIINLNKASLVMVCNLPQN
jgi:hypothetical protein